MLLPNGQLFYSHKCKIKDRVYKQFLPLGLTFYLRDCSRHLAVWITALHQLTLPNEMKGKWNWWKCFWRKVFQSKLLHLYGFLKPISLSNEPLGDKWIKVMEHGSMSPESCMGRRSNLVLVILPSWAMFT
jgi:hypothetical protein